MDIKKEIGKRIKKARQKLEWSTEDLAYQININYDKNINYRTIERYETGENTPNAELIYQLCIVLNVSADYLINGIEEDEEIVSWTDAYKCLNRLIMSLVIIPEKDNDPNSKHYGKYYFYAFDFETKLYLEKLTSFLSNKNYMFEYFNKKMFFNVRKLDELTDEFSELSENLLLSPERFRKVLKNHGEDYNMFFIDKINDIIKKRKSKE